MKQTQYKSYIEPVGFAPQKAPSFASAMERDAARQTAAEQRVLNEMRANQKVEMKNVQQAGEDLVMLGQFSQKALELGQNILKEKKENDDINETFDAMFGTPSPETPEEQQEDIDLAELDAANATASSDVEIETGSAAAGEAVRTESPSGQLLQPYREERVTLTQAQTNYSPFMSAYLQGGTKITIGNNTMTVREAVGTGDPALVSAALASGRSAFFKQFGLTNFSRRRVVKALGQTVINTDSQLLSGSVNAALKAKRETAKAEFKALSYEAGKVKPLSQIGQSFSDLSKSAWSSGAYTTRGEANLAIVKGMLSGMEARGDVTAIEELERFEKREGDPKTALRTIDPALFDKAKETAEKNLEDRLAQTNKDIKNTMFRELRGAKSQEERDLIIETAAKGLEDNGDFEAARKLRKDRDDLVVSGASEFNAARLSEGIQNGEITSTNAINQEVLAGNITEAQGKELIEELGVANGANPPKDKTAKDIADNQIKGVETLLLEVFGLKKNSMSGDIYAYDESGTLVAPEDAPIILGQVQRDIYSLTNQILEANPLLANDPIKLQETLIKELNAWKQANLFDPSGKFYVRDVQQLQESGSKLDQVTQAQRDRFSSLLADPGKMARPIIPLTSAIQPQDFSKTGVVEDGIVTPETRAAFNPIRGDYILSRGDLQGYVQKFEKGNVPARLQRTADALGMSPLALLQQQSAAYGLPVVTGREVMRARIGDSPNAYQGAQTLMEMGLPVRGAAWLSASIRHESGWAGQRPQWDLGWDGAGTNGGLLSWNRGRLARLEARYGKKTTQISTIQQLDFLMDELRFSYPEAYRIFMNPQATDRQLIRASKIYIGYNDTDISQEPRYDTARTLTSQLENK